MYRALSSVFKFRTFVCGNFMLAAYIIMDSLMFICIVLVYCESMEKYGYCFNV